MTTDEKIKNLAQSYVDELFADADMSDQETIEAKKDAFVMCMAFAGHILETHCIVPKTTIDKHYTEMAKDYAMYLDPDNKANREMIEVDSLGFLNWVMEKYCIVEKEKVNDFWHEITTVYLSGGKITYDGARFMFQSLFGKELFNTTEK